MLARARTTASLGWVAQRLKMESAADAGHYVWNWQWEEILERVPKRLRSNFKGLGGQGRETE